MNRYELVKFFFNNGCRVNCYNSLQQTPLMLAAKVGNINICIPFFQSVLSLVNLCFLHGSRTEDRDIKGMTAVHFASMNGYINILSSLRAHGACLDVRDNKGRTPLMMASQQNQIVVCSSLFHSPGI